MLYQLRQYIQNITPDIPVQTEFNYKTLDKCIVIRLSTVSEDKVKPISNLKTYIIDIIIIANSSVESNLLALKVYEELKKYNKIILPFITINEIDYSSKEVKLLFDITEPTILVDSNFDSNSIVYAFSVSMVI